MVACVTEALTWHTVPYVTDRDGTFTLVDMTKLAMEKDLPVKQVIVQIVRAHEYGVVAMCQSKKHKLMFSAGVFRVCLPRGIEAESANRVLGLRSVPKTGLTAASVVHRKL